jgi:cobalamin biosynthetic protein CobC
VSSQQVDAAVDNIDVLVLVHPNNPTGETFKVDELLHWHNKLAAKGGWLIVDEAFMDATPEFSLGAYSSREGLIVLRSLGKFFGLAGARVGCVCASPDLLNSLHAQIGPWTVNGPARWIATHALQDRQWQVATRSQLNDHERRLNELLCSHGLVPDGGCVLFKWVKTASATSIYEALAKQGVLCRLFEKPCSLRFGLPANESEWRRFDTALSSLS